MHRIGKKKKFNPHKLLSSVCTYKCISKYKPGIRGKISTILPTIYNILSFFINSTTSYSLHEGGNPKSNIDISILNFRQFISSSKLSGGQLDIALRATSQFLTQRISRHCSFFISKFIPPGEKPFEPSLLYNWLFICSYYWRTLPSWGPLTMPGPDSGILLWGNVTRRWESNYGTSSSWFFLRLLWKNVIGCHTWVYFGSGSYKKKVLLRSNC